MANINKDIDDLFGISGDTNDQIRIQQIRSKINNSTEKKVTSRQAGSFSNFIPSRIAAGISNNIVPISIAIATLAGCAAYVINDENSRFKDQYGTSMDAVNEWKKGVSPELQASMDEAFAKARESGDRYVIESGLGGNKLLRVAQPKPQEKAEEPTVKPMKKDSAMFDHFMTMEEFTKKHEQRKAENEKQAELSKKSQSIKATEQNKTTETKEVKTQTNFDKMTAEVGSFLKGAQEGKIVLSNVTQEVVEKITVQNLPQTHLNQVNTETVKSESNFDKVVNTIRNFFKGAAGGEVVVPNVTQEDVVKITAQNLPSTPEITEPNIKPTYVKDKNILLDIEQATNISIPKDLKNNQVSAHMIKELTKQEGFEKNFNKLMLAATLDREGFVNHVYNDVGYASIGAGQTMGVQSPKSVKERFSSVGINEDKVNFFMKLSGKKLSAVQLPDNYKDYTISGKEGAQVSLLQIQKDFVPTVKKMVGDKTFDNLLVQQQVALTAMSYQKGNIGDTTAKAVKQHGNWLSKNPNATKEEQIKNWSNNVTPTYSMSYYKINKDGTKEKVIDTRSLLTLSMISDNFELYKKKLGNTATPKEVKNYSAVVKEMNISLKNYDGELVKTNLLGTNFEITDPIKELKEQASNGDIQLAINREAIKSGEPEQKRERKKVLLSNF